MLDVEMAFLFWVISNVRRCFKWCYAFVYLHYNTFAGNLQR